MNFAQSFEIVGAAFLSFMALVKISKRSQPKGSLVVLIAGLVQICAVFLDDKELAYVASSIQTAVALVLLALHRRHLERVSNNSGSK